MISKLIIELCYLYYQKKQKKQQIVFKKYKYFFQNLILGRKITQDYCPWISFYYIKMGNLQTASVSN